MPILLHSLKLYRSGFQNRVWCINCPPLYVEDSLYVTTTWPKSSKILTYFPLIACIPFNEKFDHLHLSLSSKFFPCNPSFVLLEFSLNTTIYSFIFVLGVANFSMLTKHHFSTWWDLSLRFNFRYIYDAIPSCISMSM